MYKLIFLSVCFLLYHTSDAYFKDYYWRAFWGPIPTDAVLGGVSEINGSTFIGQALDSDLSPVEIHEGRREVYIPVEFPRPQTNLIKILCSNNFDMLRWYSTSAKDLHNLLAKKTVIRGGVDRKDDPFYIGRVFFFGEHIIGRVRVDMSEPYMESVYWAGGRYNYHRSTTFDVLVYEDPIQMK